MAVANGQNRHKDYSGTPLWKKLGIAEVRRRNQNIGLVGATRDPATPPGGWQRLGLDDLAP